MSSSSSSSSSDHPLSISASASTIAEQLCYVHCTICDTVLAVSVPCTSLLMTVRVTVRCGHCATLLPVNMPFPSLNQFHSLGHNFYSYPSQTSTDEIRNPNTSYMIGEANGNHLFTEGPRARGVAEELPQTRQAANRPPEKRQRVPSAYNRFIKEEIHRIKAENPDITHREAFSAAAKNFERMNDLGQQTNGVLWAHFPHIRFGVMPDQTAKRPNVRQQEGEDPTVKDGLLGAADVGISPY